MWRVLVVVQEAGGREWASELVLGQRPGEEGMDLRDLKHRAGGPAGTSPGGALAERDWFPGAQMKS